MLLKHPNSGPFKCAIAFTQLEFQPIFALPFLVNLAKHYFFCNNPIIISIGQALMGQFDLGIHTNIAVKVKDGNNRLLESKVFVLASNTT